MMNEHFKRKFKRTILFKLLLDFLHGLYLYVVRTRFFKQAKLTIWLTSSEHLSKSE